jgi:hypothetical protein
MCSVVQRRWFLLVLALPSVAFVGRSMKGEHPPVAVVAPEHAEGPAVIVEPMRAPRPVEEIRVAVDQAPVLHELAADPDGAADAIRSVAEANDDDAARKLAAWLAEETRRQEEPDARGNVVNLVEALGAVKSDRAQAALIDALGDDRHDLALKTLVVQQLRAPAARPALQHFSRFAELIQPHDDFEAELRAEALAAADETGRRIQQENP